MLVYFLRRVIALITMVAKGEEVSKSMEIVKSRGPILCVTSSETRSVCVKQAPAKFEYSSLIGQCAGHMTRFL